ncbi:phage integrase N-terminal SAM-like domain-containing protein [Truepera radiovictrix]|uniref:phage integrase N-terminal SAM-like domain-containing protein n=1 Tax=Truepera radiovictrix TaxID=332249 RepID=UPI0035934C28
MGCSTEKSYLHYRLQYINLHNRRPSELLGEAAAQAYWSHSALDKPVAASTQNVARSAPLCLCKRSCRSGSLSVTWQTWKRFGTNVPGNCRRRFHLARERPKHRPNSLVSLHRRHV